MEAEVNSKKKWIIDQRYEFIEILGEGYEGKVLLCKDLQMKTLCAVKIGTSEMSLDKEYTVSQMVKHPNVLNIYEYAKKIESNKKIPEFYNVSSYIENGCLFDYIKVCKEGFHYLISKYYLKELVSALIAFVSKGLCHRDIKPENIFLDQDFNVILGDFGFTSSSVTLKTNYKGSGVYMAPEIHAQEKPYSGHKADIFALGVTFFVLCFGQFPFETSKKDECSKYTQFQEDKKKYWEDLKVQSKEQDVSVINDDDFIDLIHGMLEDKEEERWDIKDVYNCNFLNKQDYYNNQPIQMTSEIVKDNMEELKEKVQLSRMLSNQKQQ